MESSTEKKLKTTEIVALLDLKHHPDGGFYLETFRDSSLFLPKSILPSTCKVARAVSNATYFLLPASEVVRIHRIPSAETLHFYAGDPASVFEVHDDGQIKITTLGSDIDNDQVLQYTVPPNVWFGAFPFYDLESYAPDFSSLHKAPARDPEMHYSLVGCTWAPAFQFEDSDIATHEELRALVPKAEAFLEYLIPSSD